MLARGLAVDKNAAVHVYALEAQGNEPAVGLAGDLPPVPARRVLVQVLSVVYKPVVGQVNGLPGKLVGIGASERRFGKLPPVYQKVGLSQNITLLPSMYAAYIITH